MTDILCHFFNYKNHNVGMSGFVLNPTVVSINIDIV